MERKKVVILYAGLSDYVLNVFQKWVQTSLIELHIIRDVVDKKEAPYEFETDLKYINLYDKNIYDFHSLEKLVKNIDPIAVVCSGWMERKYLKIVSIYAGRIPTIMAMDNQWHGSIKQYVRTILSRIYLVKIFSHIWVPGEPQAEYAEKLGFKKYQILRGFYVANKNNFNRPLINPQQTFSKRFVFVGRYVEIKGVKELWQAFSELEDEKTREWELHCIGTGPLFKDKVEHPKIKHIGFVQPNELKEYIKEGGVFVLPSHFEPWGVVIHEFAYAGFPMIVSDAVGSASAFVEDSVNGYVFKNTNVYDLKSKLEQIIEMPENQLIEMGSKSYQKAQYITEEKWCKTINNVIESWKPQ
ncbi:glycosyltransferase family 4 protein [Sulfurovum sp.]|uniref:glycosyltransferase family 4 protein n=1 Tax=Sulfurovum sp. TaxID=1969726 RepID=UPI0035665AE6